MNSVAKSALAALIVLATLVVVPPSVASAAPVTCGGLVFEDYDADGERSEDYSFAFDSAAPSSAYDNVLDPGVAGVTATVTTASGAVETDTTNAAGEWSVTVDDADFPVRVEFSTLPTDWNPGASGADSGTLTQFIQAPADCADPSSGSGPDGNVGIVAPGTFCENRPEFLTSCFLFGNFADHDNQPAVVAVLDGSQDNNAETNWQSPAYTVQATLGEVGSVWGTGLDRTTGDTYVGAFVKRHTQLAGNPTTIYRITDGGAVAPWFTTDPSAVDPHTAAADAAALGLADPVDGWIYDYGSFDDVGTSGLGDVEVSVDGNTLYTVDLGRRELVAIPILPSGAAGTPTRTAISAGSLGISSCPSSDIRPFGLGIDEAGLLHVGAVCSAESTVADPFTPIADTGPVLGDPTQLAAWVFTFDGSNFALKTDVPVPTTTRGSSVGGSSVFAHQAQWRPWVNRMPYEAADISSYGNTYPQPIVSDIEFDGDDMIVGIMDRWGHQTGANAFYEDWSSATQPNGGFAAEQPVSSGDTVRAVYNGTGFDFPLNGLDYTYEDGYGTSHQETTLGSMAQIPGRPYMVAASFDPNSANDTWQSGGLEWFDNTSGDHVNGYRLYNGRPLGEDVGTFEKAAGVGDLEADCGTATIQVGNRVFFDADDDGIQDPDEAGLAGITIELLNSSGTVIDTVVTDAAGQWVFDDVAPNTDRTARIAQVNYDTGGVFAAGGTHDGLGAITISDAGSDDGNDADAVLVGGLPSIPFNVNASNHTLDFGMVVAGTLRVGNRVWLDQDGNGSQNGTEPGIDGVEVQLWSADGAGNPVALIATDTTSGGGFYVFESLYAGDYVIAIADTQQAAGQQLAGLASTSGNGTAPDPDDNVELDDNGDPAVGFASISEAITLTSGGEPIDDLDEGGWADDDSNLTVDFGFIERLRLGNLVFEDLNADGDADAGEPGIADVSVQLWSVDGAGDPDSLLAIDITDANGFYEFVGLEPGDYIVAISDGEQVTGNELHRLVSTSGNGIAPDVDTNASDNDDNGEPATGFASITAPVTLIGGTEPTGETDEDGAYTDDRSNLTVDLGFVRTYRLGNLVWFDVNNNGVADAGETPVSGVEVQLWSADGAGAPVAQLDAVDTDANGRYVFEDLAAGDYIVAIPDAEQGAGQPLNGLVSSLGATVAPDPDNGTDNDDNGTPTTGFAAISSAVTLNNAAPTSETDGLAGGSDEDPTWVDATSDLSVDFGFVGSLRLGNRVWLDQDGNGSQNGTEPGIDGVEVQLWSVDGAGDPVAIIATDTTAAGGFYIFENLVAGDYVVAIADTEQAAGEVLAGLGSTAGNGVAPDPDDNADLDDNGDAAPGFASISAPVTLAAGTEPTGEVNEAGWVDNDSNLTVDFGFLPGLRLGNLVFEDLNADGDADAGEPGIAGVTVQLWSVDGAGDPLAQIATDETDANGFYGFDGLLPGDYIVAISDGEQAAGNELHRLASTDGNGAAPDPDDNTDLDDNGDPIAGFASTTAPVTLTASAEPAGEPEEDGVVGDNNSNLTVDLGFVRSYRLGNLVWFDVNNNGIADAGEAPLAGVEVQLWSVDGSGDPLAELASVDTDANGQYVFEDLAAGDYIVAIADAEQGAGQSLNGLVSSLGATVAPGPDNGTDNDDNGTPATGFAAISSAVTLNNAAPIGETDGLAGGSDEDPSWVDATSDLTVDFGFVGSLRLGNRVWLDQDGNGSQNGTEPGIDGVEVQLWSVDGAGDPVAIIATDTTAAGGFYVFENLAPGDYVVAIADTEQAAGQPLEGLGSTAGNGVAPDPDDNADLDDNGDAAPGFASISAPVTLAAGTEPTSETDEAGWVDNDSNLTVDFGFLPGLRLGNLVFEDLNADGDVDAGEPGIAGVTVELWSVDASGDPLAQIATDETDANGFYGFDGLLPGDYIVAISDGEQAAGNELHRLASTDGNGVAPDADTDATDSDDNGDPIAGFASITAPVTLTASAEPAGEPEEDGVVDDNDSNLTVDLGFVRTYRLGNLVWFDVNNNGIADAGEAPLAGVEVQLWGADGAGAPVTLLDSVDTDANGQYVFEDLAAGDYVVAIADTQQATGQPINGMSSSLGATVAPDPDNGTDNDDNGTPAAGFAAISAAVTLDSNAPLLETDGLNAGVDEDGNWPDLASDLTVDFGFVGSLRLGNRVWLDQDGNGSQNGTEPGIDGVEVQLWSVDGAGDPVAIIATDTTAAGGFYVFENLAPGDYVVAIADTEQGVGEALEGLGSTLGSSAPNLNSDLNDSGDAAPGFASISAPVTLAAGTEPTSETDEAGWVDNDSNLTVDFGFVAGVEIGNLVWFDANNDGNVDAGEPAISGVTVNLLDTNDVVVATTTTDADGHYVFTGIAPGQYVVEIPANQFEAGAPLANHYPSDGTFVSGNPNDDTDDNSDGAPDRPVAAPVRSGTITVAEGAEPTDEVDESPTGTADDASNLTVDFGFYNVSLGDLVWFDDDNNGVRNGSEAPVVGVILNLLDENNQPVLGADGEPLTTVTDSNGQYQFEGLEEGTYVVEIPASQFAPGAPLVGRASSSGNDVNGTAPDPDDDADGDDNGDFYFGGVTRTKPIAVSAGDEPGISDNPTVDLGFTPAAGLGTYVWVDTDRDGAQDANEPGVPGVVVTVFDAETNAVVAIEVTDANGAWTVTGLPPGTYYVEFRDPAGRPFTPADANTNDGIDSDAGIGGRTNVVVLGIGEYDPTVDAGIVSQTTITTTITSRLPDTGSELMNYLTLATLLIAAGSALLMTRRVRTSPRS